MTPGSYVFIPLRFCFGPGGFGFVGSKWVAQLGVVGATWFRMPSASGHHHPSPGSSMRLGHRLEADVLGVES